jgi:1-acyl-sn-glycerol-3-phosphate acyltransferase
MKRALLVAALRLISGAAPRWTAAPCSASTQCIYFANHTSHLDAVVLWACLPPDLRGRTRPVAAKDYWDRSALRRHLAHEVFNAVLIDRTKVSAHNNPIERMLAAMGEKFSLIIFPEGSRGAGNAVGPFKSGLYHLAREKPDLSFVPVFIENLNRILPKGEFLPVPLLSSIIFGAPLPLKPEESKPAFLERAHRAVCALNPNHDVRDSHETSD